MQKNRPTPLKQIDTRTYQQLCFCGDLHGRFDLLQQALQQRRFNPDSDLLVLVGDLIDRGAYCPQIIDFVLQGLKEGYVAMVTGNHDHYPLGDYHHWMKNDGYWFDALKLAEPATAQALLQKLRDLAAEPLALELLTAHGRIGVVHGDVPENCWDRLTQLALKECVSTAQHGEPGWQRTLLSGRSILKARQLAAPGLLKVSGIDYVVSGHVVVSSPEFIGNRAYIYTGAYYTERLTVMSLAELLAGFAANAR